MKRKNYIVDGVAAGLLALYVALPDRVVDWMPEPLKTPRNYIRFSIPILDSPLATYRGGKGKEEIIVEVYRTRARFKLTAPEGYMIAEDKNKDGIFDTLTMVEKGKPEERKDLTAETGENALTNEGLNTVIAEATGNTFRGLIYEAAGEKEKAAYERSQQEERQRARRRLGEMMSNPFGR